MWGRVFMGDTLAFHILFAMFGVGIPLMVSLAELLGIARRDAAYVDMARRWTFTMAVFFVSGAVSGTVVAVAMTVLWPGFMAFIGRVVALPFALEITAFFLEAIFLGVYAYTWDAWKGRWTHWLTSLPVVLGSLASAFFITTVNAFMNTPAGFTLSSGAITKVNQVAAMLNPATPTETIHSILSYYAATALFFGAVAAIMLLARRNGGPSDEKKAYARKMLVFSLAFGLLFSVLVGVSGSSSAQFIAQHEAEKFAAAEGVFTTGPDMSLAIGGIVSGRSLAGAVNVPELLSVLTGGSTATVIMGLDRFDPSTWPPLVVHYFFDLMAAIGIAMVAVPVIFFALQLAKRRAAFSRAMLWIVFATGMLPVVAVESGWLVTELGRQPYIIRNVMLVRDAYTTAQGVPFWSIAFPIFYLVLAVMTMWVITKHYRKYPL